MQPLGTQWRWHKWLGFCYSCEFHAPGVSLGPAPAVPSSSGCSRSLGRKIASRRSLSLLAMNEWINQWLLLKKLGITYCRIKIVNSAKIPSKCQFNEKVLVLTRNVNSPWGANHLWGWGSGVRYSKKCEYKYYLLPLTFFLLLFLAPSHSSYSPKCSVSNWNTWIWLSVLKHKENLSDSG